MFLIVGTSCDNYLEEVPKSSISPANFYKTEDDALSSINGAYAALQDNAYYSRYYVTSSEHAGGNCYTRTGDAGEQGVLLNLIDNGMINSFRYNISVWKAIWQAVNRANSVLTHVPDIEMDADLKARILAEAKFLRALNYFNLVRRWGGVPIILSETNSSDLIALQVVKNSVR